MTSSPAAKFGVGFNTFLALINTFMFYQLNLIDIKFKTIESRIHQNEGTCAGLNASVAAIATTVARNTLIVNKLDGYAADPERHRMHDVEARLRELEIRLEGLLTTQPKKPGGP